MGKKKQGNRESELYQACEALFAEQRFDEARAQYCADADGKDVGQWKPAEIALPAEISAFRQRFGRDEIVGRLNTALEKAADAFVGENTATVRSAIFASGTLASFATFLIGGALTSLGAATALATLPLAAALTGLSLIGNAERRLDRFDDETQPLRVALTGVVKSHRSAFDQCAQTRSEQTPSGQSFALSQTLWSASQLAANTVEDFGRELVEEPPNGSGALNIGTLTEGLLALVALSGVTFILSTYLGSVFFPVLLAAAIAVAALGAGIMSRRQDQQFADGKAALVQHMFGIDRTDKDAPTTALRAFDPSFCIASQFAAGATTPPKSLPPRMSHSSAARDVHRLRLAAAPADDGEKRLPRNVWEA